MLAGIAVGGQMTRVDMMVCSLVGKFWP